MINEIPNSDDWRKVWDAMNRGANHVHKIILKTKGIKYKDYQPLPDNFYCVPDEFFLDDYEKVVPGAKILLQNAARRHMIKRLERERKLQHWWYYLLSKLGLY